MEEKPRTNIYTMMLILSFLAVTIACVLLWLELKAYGDFPQWKTSNVSVPTASAPDLDPLGGRWTQLHA